jgi:signal transduction histidine kinase
MRRDGSIFWGSGSMMAMHDSDGNCVGLLKILRDQTELRRTVDELKRARVDSENAMHAKDHFLAVLSHELRTPLGPVLMGVDGLLESPPDQRLADSREDLEMIRKYVTVETQLIDDLLDSTRIASGKLELVRADLDIHSTIRDAGFVCHQEFTAKNLHLESKLEAALFQVHGDERRLKQVFWNLLRNAVKFSAPSATIVVDSRNEGNEIVVNVVDTGRGLDPELTEKIFQPFAQADRTVTRQFGGLGLGLSISRSIVEAHGGRLTCHSDGYGNGCRFEVRLPLNR